MGDAENALPPSKKRAAGREISRDNPGLDDEDAPEQETGTFQRASDDILAARRIVKVHRNQTPAAPSSNPFASISLVPPTDSNSKIAQVTDELQPVAEKPSTKEAEETCEANSEREKGPEVAELKEKDAKLGDTTDEPKVESATNEDKSDSANKVSATTGADEKEILGDESGKTVGNEESGKEAKKDEECEKEDKKENGYEDATASGASAPVSSFQQLSSNQNAFTGLTGTGFSSSSFSFGSTPKEMSAFGASSGSLLGLKNHKPPSFPSFSFGNSNNGSSSLFGASGASDVTKSESGSFPSKQEVSVETGEENENTAFTADAMLFEYNGGWKERGKGELKVNVSTTGIERARLLMRARGNYRLILNASLYPDMKLTNMEKRGITFACVNSTGEGKDSLSTFALKFKDGSVVEEFRTAVTVHKGKKDAVLKTPENSPKASDD